MSPHLTHAGPCACQGPRTAGESSLVERIGKDLRDTTVPEWIQIALAAGALYLSYRIYKEVRS